jgi:amphi-Trp domain-containing protein
MSADQEFEFEGVATPSEAADTLARIAEGIRARSLSLTAGDEEITVFPDGHLMVQIGAKRTKAKGTIDIGVAWRHPRV